MLMTVVYFILCSNDTFVHCISTPTGINKQPLLIRLDTGFGTKTVDFEIRPNPIIYSISPKMTFLG